MAGKAGGLGQPGGQKILPTKHLQHNADGGHQAPGQNGEHESLGQFRDFSSLGPHAHPSCQQNHGHQIRNADQKVAEVGRVDLQRILGTRQNQPKTTQQAQAIEAKLLVFSRQVPMGRTPEQAQTQKGQQVGVDARRQRIDVRHRGDGNHHQH